MRNEPVPGFRISDITVFSAIGDDDEEGVTAFMADTGWMPMIAADINRLGQLRTIAEQMRALGEVITERHFVPAGQVSDPDLCDELAVELEAEKELADDLMDVLSRMVVGWENIIGHDLSQHPDVQRVAARYRQARGR